jgi:hypothetical protein
VQRFRDKDMRKSKPYSMWHESFFTRRAVASIGQALHAARALPPISLPNPSAAII